MTKWLQRRGRESEQIITICELNQLLDDCYLDPTKKVVLAGDFNLFFEALLEALGVIQHWKKIDLKGFAINRTT